MMTASRLPPEPPSHGMAHGTWHFLQLLEVMMAENPMISLVLYYFSADLKTTVFAEAGLGFRSGKA